MLGGRTVCALGLAAVFLSAPAVPAWAGEATPKVRHRDPTWKFSILMFEEWKAVPIPQAPPDADDLDKDVVARFIERGDGDARFNLPDGNRGIAEVFVVGAADDTRMDLLLSRAAERHGVKLTMGQGKPIKTKDGVAGTSWFIPWEDNDHRFQAAAVWKKDGVRLGLWIAAHYVSSGGQMGIERVINSVLWADDRAAPPAGSALLDGLKLSPERRKAIERSVVKGWGLLVSPAKQYIVVYNAKGGKNVRLAQVIAERIEAIRKQQYEVLFPHAEPIDATSVVRVCVDREEYLDYGAPRGSAGYWDWRDEELVFYDQEPGRAPDDGTIAVLYHEAFHQYVFYAAGRVAPHSWFNEGHGDFFAGAKFQNGKFRIEPNLGRLWPIYDVLAPDTVAEPRPAGTPRALRRSYPLTELVEMTRDEFYEQPSLTYPQGWSLVYFLRAIVPTRPEWNAKWGKIPDTYFRALRDATASVGKAAAVPTKPPSTGPAVPPKPPEEGAVADPGVGTAPESGDQDEKALAAALKAAFDGVDLAELEEAWKKSIVELGASTFKRKR
jgi:hypothetical protein